MLPPPAVPRPTMRSRAQLVYHHTYHASASGRFVDNQVIDLSTRCPQPERGPGKTESRNTYRWGYSNSFHARAVE